MYISQHSVKMKTVEIKCHETFYHKKTHNLFSLIQAVKAFNSAKRKI